MPINIYKDPLQKARLFGASVLYSSEPIPREDVPPGWYGYDLQGTTQEPDRPYCLVDQAEKNYAGSVLSYLPLKSGRSQKRLVKDMFQLTGTELTLAEFCEEEKLRCPETPLRHLLRPASTEEAGLFYAQTPEKDEELGTIGHVRIDFGSGGREFWHTWWPRGPEELNTSEFREELGRVVDDLRKGVLKDLSSMRRYCYGSEGALGDPTASQRSACGRERRKERSGVEFSPTGGNETCGVLSDDGGSCCQNYGFTLETERYLYRLRCNPVDGDYQCYLSCFDKEAQTLQQGQLVGHVSFADGTQLDFTDPEGYIQAIREELPYMATTGFRYETLTDEPEVRDAVDDIVCDFYGEESPRQLEEQEEQTMTFGGM